MRYCFAKTSLLLLSLLLIQGCELETTSTDPNAGVIKDKDGKIIEGDFKQFWDNGNLAAEMTFKDKKLHGRAVKYYKDGKTKRSELNYNKGKLDGIQKRYYESGKLYKEENYKNGKRQGLTKKYRESGILMSEAIYKNGFAGTVLKEYLPDGKRKKKYPKIMTKVKDNLTTNGSYTLQFYLSDKSKNVKYYLGYLDEGKFLHDKLVQQSNVIDGVLTYNFFLQPGDSRMKELNIIAKKITRLNNVFVTTKKYRLGIEYPLY